MPSSIPSPARRIGTTSGRGSASRQPLRRRRPGVSTVTALGAHVARRLVGEQRHQLFGQRAEGRRRGRLVAQHRELVGDEGVVGHVDSHTLDANGGRWHRDGRSRGCDARGPRRGAARAHLGRRARSEPCCSMPTARCSRTRRNERELLDDPTAHAEVLAIRRAAELRGDWRLDRHHARGDARAVRAVRGRDPGRAHPAAGVRRVGREGRRGRQRLRRAARPAAAAPGRGRSTGVLADESAALLAEFFARRQGDRSLERVCRWCRSARSPDCPVIVDGSSTTVGCLRRDRRRRRSSPSGSATALHDVLARHGTAARIAGDDDLRVGRDRIHQDLRVALCRGMRRRRLR